MTLGYYMTDQSYPDLILVCNWRKILPTLFCVVSGILGGEDAMKLDIAYVPNRT